MGSHTFLPRPGWGVGAYFILTQTVTDQTTYSDEYIPGVLPFLAGTARRYWWLPSRQRPSKGSLLTVSWF